MDEAGRVFTEAETELADAVMANDGQKKKEDSQLDKLQKELDKAVTEERYEDAAKLRDEIKRLENLHSDN